MADVVVEQNEALGALHEFAKSHSSRSLVVPERLTAVVQADTGEKYKIEADAKIWMINDGTNARFVIVLEQQHVQLTVVHAHRRTGMAYAIRVRMLGQHGSRVQPVARSGRIVA